MRAFSLIEVMVVLAVIGVLTAASVPGISAMVVRANGDSVLRENAAGFAVARDNARGRGVCLDYVLRSATVARPATYPPIAAVGAGPYELDIWAVACPGEVGAAQFIVTREVSPILTQMSILPIIGGTPQAPDLDRVHFHRDGSLYDPVAPLLVESTCSGVQRRFRVFPAAGTIEFEES